MGGASPKPPRRRPTLRRRLYLLFLQWLGVFLVVSGGITALTLMRFREEVGKERLLLARTVAHEIDATLGNSLQALQRLPAELPGLDESARGRLRAHRFQGIFRDAIHLLDEDGRVLLSEPAFAAAPPVEWLRRLPGVSPLVARPGEAEGRTLVAVEPFRRRGRLYHLVAEASPAGSPLSLLLQELAAEPDLHLVVIDSAARILAAPDRRQLFGTVEPEGRLADHIQAKRPLVAEVAGCTACPPGHRDGDSYLTVMVPLRTAPWGVVIQQSEAQAFSMLTPPLIGLLAVSALLVLMGLLLSHGVARSVVTPIRELSDRAQRLREGDLESPIAVDGDLEIQILAGSLDEARLRIGSNLAELQRLNGDLEQMVAELVDDKQRRVLVRRLLAAGEEERRRIARELHDEISQLLTVIQLSLERIPSQEGDEVLRARELLSRTQHEIHRIIYDLRPSLLDDLGLAAAVEWYAESYLARRGIAVGIEVEDGLELPSDVEITTFRIVQEIVTNVLRHSAAENVSIELYVAGDELVLGVEDDGVGFRPAERTDGVGFVGMRERAALVGGRVEIDSEPGAGTSVRLTIPLPPASRGGDAREATPVGGAGLADPAAAAGGGGR
jgi:signal transduction histidine kinase